MDSIIGAVTLSECHGRQHRKASSSGTIAFPMYEVESKGSPVIEIWVHSLAVSFKVISL